MAEHHEFDDAMAAVLELDAEVSRPLTAEVTGWLAELTGAVRRVLDLGAGTGAGTVALRERFPDAEVVAVDGSAALLERLAAKADGAVRTVRADLDDGLPELEPVDLVWSSAALHHLADPQRALGEVFRLLRPGGLLAAVEVDSLPWFLPHELGFGRPGLESRCQAAADAARAAHLPEFGADWAPRLAQAGFAVEAERTFALGPLPGSPLIARFAQVTFQRMRAGLAGRLDAEDLAALDRLLDADDPHSLLHRDDLAFRTERRVWIGRR